MKWFYKLIKVVPKKDFEELDVRFKELIKDLNSSNQSLKFSHNARVKYQTRIKKAVDYVNKNKTIDKSKLMLILEGTESVK